MGAKHVKYGGVRFENLVPPQEINRFVRELPEEKRSSLFQVIQELRDAGLIEVYDGDNITIDDEMQPYLEPNADEKTEE